MTAKNASSISQQRLENSPFAACEGKAGAYRAPEKRMIGSLELIKGRNFNDDKDRGNENYYR
jgi:hypothetical protein